MVHYHIYFQRNLMNLNVIRRASIFTPLTIVTSASQTRSLSYTPALTLFNFKPNLFVSTSKDARFNNSTAIRKGEFDPHRVKGEFDPHRVVQTVLSVHGIPCQFCHWLSSPSVQQWAHLNSTVRPRGYCTATTSTSNSDNGPTKSSSSDSAKELTSLTPSDFAANLKEHAIKRCFIIYDSAEKKLVTSHPQLQQIADFFTEDDLDFRQHEGIFLELGKRTGALLGAFIWKTSRGQGYGGLRLWHYATMEGYLRDGLRLSVGMGIKSALAGLWTGGGQGVICEPPNDQHLIPDFRRQIFYDYGDFLTSLNGAYICTSDLGVEEFDLDNVHTRTRYATCISPDLGGSGNPSVATGKGVICSMEGALAFRDEGTLKNKTVAIQGAGNVAVVVIEELLKRDVKHIFVTDCHQNRVRDVTHMFTGIEDGKLTVQKVPHDDNAVLSYDCDILAPCALGNVLDAETIPTIRANIICGAASNQLAREEDNQLLRDRGITFVPDFIANRMGIVNCASEDYGRLPDDPAIQRHFEQDWDLSIFQMTKKILEKADKDNVTPATAAMGLAAGLCDEDHLIWPGRTRKIITSLSEKGWHKGHDYWQV